MAFKQYTKCTPTSSYDPLNRPLVVFGGIAGFVTLILAIIIGGVVAPWLIAAGAAAGFATISAVFEYLLGGKLICLGGDELATGQVVGMEPADAKPFPDNLDNDLSIEYEGNREVYIGHKGLMGSGRCFQQIHVDFKFSSTKTVIDEQIQGGTFVE